MSKSLNVTKLLENVGNDWDRTHDTRVKELQESLLHVLPDGFAKAKLGSKAEEPIGK